MSQKPYILNIGGFDPCNGAGVTADLKTFTVLDVYALTVQTCLTIQNESEIRKIYWFTFEQIKEQIDVLVDLYHWEYVKLSLTNGLKNALEIIEYIHQVSDAKIIWDPVMRSSSGYDFYKGVNAEILDTILSKVYLVTPNWNELEKWDEKSKTLAVASKKSRITNIYLKGGHNVSEKGVDYLFLNTGKIEKLQPKALSKYEKHGSGCVFASALIAFLAHGNDLVDASSKAKNCILQFLDSNESMLGYHCNPEEQTHTKTLKIVGFSHPDIVEDESHHINQLFENGLDQFVIRKLNWTDDEVLDLIDLIDESFHKKITVCDRPDIVLLRRIGGLHCSNAYYDSMLKIEQNQLHQKLDERGQEISISAHNSKEWEKRKGKFDQLYLCPIFDSISKPGYKGSWDHDWIKEEIEGNDHNEILVALGGVHSDNIEEVIDIGFDGVGILGAIWNDTENCIKHLKQLKKKLKSPN